MVENKLLGRGAPLALRALPKLALNFGEVSAVAQLFSGFRLSLQKGQHLISVDKPSLLERRCHPGSHLWRVLEAFRGSGSLAVRSCTMSRLDSFDGFRRVRFSPKWIIRTAHAGAFAFTLSAGFADAASNVGGSSVEIFATDHALAYLSGADVWHKLQQLNRVNSWEHSKVSVEDIGVNHEPSRACSNLRIVRGAEGATTRACGNNTGLTSARRHGFGDDIVWTAWQHAEAVHKQIRDNTIDEVLNIQPSDVFTAAEFPFRQAAVAVSISGLEMLQNSGRERVIDLLESRIKNAEKTFMNGLSYDVYSDGSLPAQIGGLQFLVASSPSTGIVGGIDRATWSFWQNQTFAATATGGAALSASNVYSYMLQLYTSLIRQQDRPDLILASSLGWRAYNESLHAIQRITSTDNDMAKAGYMSIKFMDADVVLDGGFQGTTTDGNTFGSGGAGAAGGMPSGVNFYFLNTDYIYLRPHKDRNMTPLDPDRFSVNQDAMVKLVGWAGNMTISNSFLQGVIVT